MKNEYFIVTLQKDSNSDDVFMPIPDEILNKLQWKCGDTVELKVNDDGSISVIKLPHF